MADILIIAGSKSDKEVVDRAEAVLKEAHADYTIEYCSFHREPKRLEEVVRKSKAGVCICIAGLSAALPGQSPR